MSNTEALGAAEALNTRPPLPATRAETFTLAEAPEREPSDFHLANAHAVAHAQAWAICAATWREVEPQKDNAISTEGGITLYQLAHACQGLTAHSFVDWPTAEKPAGLYGTGGQILYMLMAGEGQKATIANALQLRRRFPAPDSAHPRRGAALRRTARPAAGTKLRPLSI